MLITIFYVESINITTASDGALQEKEIMSKSVSISANEISGTEYYIKNVYSGKYLDVSGGTASNGANVQQYEFNGTEAQRWRIQLKPNTNNEFYILTRVGNDGYQYMYSLDISGGSNSDGANVQIYEYNNSSAQTFKISYNSEFNFSIKSACSNYNTAISISTQGFNNELNVVQKNVSSNANQCWLLEPVYKNRSFGQKYAYANTYNHLITYPNCESAGGDCTNFASQCLVATGQHYVDNWYIYKKNTLFEKPSNIVTLRSSWDTGDPAPWLNADDFKWYWGSDNRIEKGEAYLASYVANNMSKIVSETKLQVGDIIQLAYREGDEIGKSHHTMFVSSVSSNDYYIAEHTSAAYDKSITSIAKSNSSEILLFYKFR